MRRFEKWKFTHKWHTKLHLKPNHTKMWDMWVYKGTEMMCGVTKNMHFVGEYKTSRFFFWFNFQLFFSHTRMCGACSQFKICSIKMFWYFISNDTNFTWKSSETPLNGLWLIYCFWLDRNALYKCINKLISIKFWCISFIFLLMPWRKQVTIYYCTLRKQELTVYTLASLFFLYLQFICCRIWITQAYWFKLLL